MPDNRHYDTLEIGRHRSKAELIDLLNEAIELAEEGWSYAPEYFRTKWDSEGRLAGLRGVFDHAR